MKTNRVKYDRAVAEKLPVEDRIKNFDEFVVFQTEDEIKKQASRCLDCGIAYCNYACPLGNVLPDLNELVSNGNWSKALEMLHRTNNFPEFTGRLCPALCEASCSLGIHEASTTTKEIELSIIEKGFEEGWVKAQPAIIKKDKKVAVIGSGPSGLTVAQQLVRQGYGVTVYERSDEIGGILAKGIPDYKLEKKIIKRRLNQLKEEGVVFKINSHVGVDIQVEDLEKKYDAICLAGGSTIPRDIAVDGRKLKGIHYAMDYLVQQNDVNAGKTIEDRIDAKDKKVVIIGGGDTGADCLGVAIRQNAKEVFQLELMPKPPETRTESMIWPYWPMTLKHNSAHEEGGVREWNVATKYFSGTDGKVERIHCAHVTWVETNDNRVVMEEVQGSEFIIEADLVLFAIGFIHPEHKGLLYEMDIELDDRGNVRTNDINQTNKSHIFAAGDMSTGQSLVCKAIADARVTADAMHAFLK